MLNILIFVLCGTSASSYVFDVKTEEILNKSHTMVLAIDRILDDFISKQSKTLLVCRGSASLSQNELKPSELFDDFLLFMSNRTTITFLVGNVKNEDEKFRNNLFIVDGWTSFREIYRSVKDNIDPNGHFIIVLTNSDGSYHENLDKIFSDYWAIHATNVVILLPTRNYKRVLLYTYFPYSEGHCEQVQPILRNYFENNCFNRNLSHFPDKFANFHQCIMHVTVCNDPPYSLIPNNANYDIEYDDFRGLDALSIKELATRLNFKPRIMPLYSADKGYQDHVYDLVNISVCGQNALKRYGYVNSFPYAYDFALFIIPRGKAYSSLEKLFFPFKMEVWIGASSIFLVMVVAVLTLKFMDTKKCEIVIGPNNDAPFLNLLSIVVGGSMTTHQLPQKNFARTILAILLLTTLILRNAYLGNLFNFLRTQKRMKQLNYVQDVLESDVSIYSLRDIRIDRDIPAIGDRMTTSNRKLEDIRDAISDDNLDGVYITLKTVADYNDLLNFQKPKLLTTKEYIVMYHIVMRLRKFLKPSIDRQIVALLSSGLVQYWQKSYTKTVNNDEDKNPKQLDIDEFTGIIAICGAMYALSIVLFIREIDISIKGTFKNYVTQMGRRGLVITCQFMSGGKGDEAHGPEKIFK